MLKFAIIIIFFAFAIVRAQDIIITDHPQSIKECIRNSASLSVSTYSLSDKVLSFQWYKDNVMITNENTPVLKFPSLQHNQSGTYYCEISNIENETIKSNFVSVYVITPTSITKQPDDVYTSMDNEKIQLSFKAHVSGFVLDDAIQNEEFVSIQWFRVIENINHKLINNETFDGVNSSELSINLRTLPDTSYYFAEIIGKCGIINTRIVSVIKNLFLVQLEIANLDACEGNNDSIRAQIINPYNHNLEFQWCKDGKPIFYKENIKGIFSDEIIFNPIFMTDAGKYKLEAKIKEMNYSVFSNEVDVNVGKEPKIVCFRADTLRINTDDVDKQNGRNVVTGWTKDVRLVIFYEFNTIPIQFDIYREKELISTLYSNETVWHLGDIHYLNFDVDRDDEAKYLVVAHNNCGIVFSDTVSVKTENLCDPYNQRQHLCEEERLYFQVDYMNPNKEISLEYYWMHIYDSYGSQIKVPYSAGGLIREKNYLFTENHTERLQGNHHFKIYNHSQMGLKIKNQVSTSGWESIFCCLDIYLDYIPILNRGPENRTVNYRDKDTLFKISYRNDVPNNMDIYLSIKYLKDLNSAPQDILTTIITDGSTYYYIKDVEMSDDGFYYASAKNYNDCEPVISDTVRVTVIPKGGTTSVSSFESNSGLFIQPNPASEFITIQFQTSEVSEYPEILKIQIFDMLGMEIMSESIHPMTGSHRMNVEKLPAGVYFFRIGNRVEKFVKM